MYFFPMGESITSALREPLDRILGRTTHVRILRALVQHGDLLSTSQLATWTKLPTRTVRQAVQDLTHTRVLKTVGDRATRLYALDSDHPLSAALRGLFQAEQQRFENLLRCVATTIQARQVGVRAAWLYGSTARRQDGFNSDLDLAIVVDDDAQVTRTQNALADEFAEIERRYDASLSPVVVSRADITRLIEADDPWWHALRRDARHLLGTTPNGLERALTDKRQRV